MEYDNVHYLKSRKANFGVGMFRLVLIVASLSFWGWIISFLIRNVH